MWGVGSDERLPQSPGGSGAEVPPRFLGDVSVRRPVPCAKEDKELGQTIGSATGVTRKEEETGDSEGQTRRRKERTKSHRKSEWERGAENWNLFPYLRGLRG